MMVTGLDNREDLIKAIELRVHYFIEKPIKPARFKNILAECIKSYCKEERIRTLNICY